LGSGDVEAAVVAMGDLKVVTRDEIARREKGGEAVGQVPARFAKTPGGPVLR
jgi:hypothetical protein